MRPVLIPHTLQSQIKGISVRGRMAYAITCLEAVLEQYPVIQQERDALLEIFWQFVENEQGWKWDEDRREHDLLMSIGDYVGGWTKSMPQEYGCSTLPHFVLRIIWEMDELGLAELYGAIQSYSPQTFQSLMAILELMVTNGFALPAIEPFLRSPFSENGGWGRAVPRTFFKA